MNKDAIYSLLQKVKKGKISVDQACEELRKLPFKDLSFAKVDHHREIRTGYPEVIFCPGKTDLQIFMIFKELIGTGSNIIATRAKKSTYNFLSKRIKNIKYNMTAGIIYYDIKKVKMNKGYIAVVSAGTSDMPVAEEAAFTAEKMGNNVKRFYDVGVAGIHRLFSNIDDIMKANVIVVAAGMEGALAGVVGGLVDKPVIAVPTSIGYGANFKGLSALLAMLNSCSSGTAVVNIDNGFGAGYMAAIINKMANT